MTDTTPAVSAADLEEVKLQLDSVNRKITETNKQFQAIQKTLDLIYQDRDLLVDLGNAIEKVRSLVIISDKHNEQLTKQVTHTVEQKTEEVKADVAVTSSEVKNTVVQRLIRDIKKTFSREDAKLVKIPWWRRLTFRKKPVTPKE